MSAQYLEGTGVREKSGLAGQEAAFSNRPQDSVDFRVLLATLILMITTAVIKRLRVRPKAPISLHHHDPSWSSLSPVRGKGLRPMKKGEVKDRAQAALEESLKDLREAQDLLWASDQYSLLIVLQAMDAAGKDGMIKHVMSGVNPQGCEVRSFKQPSSEELDHSFLWRVQRVAPERGKICIFNRSHYEDVLVVRVHPELLRTARVPDTLITDRVWAERFEDINAFERHLHRNGTRILKFFLHISKDEQKKRFLDRLEDPQKHWKFSAADVAEREHWDKYQRAYEQMLSETSTPWAPWHIIPSNNKWVSRALVAEIVARSIRDLDLSYPRVDRAKRLELQAARRALMRER